MSRTAERILKGVLHLLFITPFVALLAGAFMGKLGANPVEVLTHETGEWALRLLILVLMVTPLRKLTGWNWMVRQRRMIGLYGFFYVVCHLTTYVWLDQFFDLETIFEDIVKRPYITVGFSAFLLLIPLAATSNNAMVKRLGARRWRALHRAAYVAALLGVVHFLWLVKADLREPLVYASVLGVFLCARLPWRTMLDKRKANALKSASN
jgi:methionine sulfoxide reductase heme-binding subunit